MPASVLHVVDSLERGGLERVVCDLALSQQRAGSRVSVFCLYRKGPLTLELEEAGIPVFCAGKLDGISLLPLLRLRSSALASPGWDIVHAHNLVPNFYCALALMFARHAPQLVNTCHDMGTRLAEPGLRRKYLWSLRHTARVAMVANEVLDRYVAEHFIEADKGRVIYNGVPTQKFHSSPGLRERGRDLLGLARTAIVIGTVGRLVALKNQSLLLQAFARVLPDIPELRLVLVGGGALEPDLRLECMNLGIADRVMFAGERQDVSDLLPAFDIFALPSITEGLSVALLEAACAGLAIVATDVGGNPRVVSSGQTGFLVPSRDLHALSTALQKLATDADLRKHLGQAARTWALENATVESQRLDYESLYAAALGRAC